MPDEKISQLPDGSPSQATDQIPVNRGGTNYRVNAGTIVPNFSAFPSTIAQAGDLIPVSRGGSNLTTTVGNLGTGIQGPLSVSTVTATSVAMGSLTLNGNTMQNIPVMTWGNYISGTWTITASGWNYFTPAFGITVIRIEAGFDSNTCSGMSPFPTIRVTNGTNNADCVITGSTLADSGPLNVTFAAGVRISLNTLQGTGGSGSSANAHITIQYRMT